MENSEKLILARVLVGLISIAVVTLALLLYNEYSDMFYQQVEGLLVQSMIGSENPLASQ
jgi:putative effector of murein hydrolase